MGDAGSKSALMRLPGRPGRRLFGSLFIGIAAYFVGHAAGLPVARDWWGFGSAIDVGCLVGWGVYLIQSRPIVIRITYYEHGGGHAEPGPICRL